MLGALVQGRVSLDGSAGAAARIGLAIATRYAEQRRQFTGPDQGEETVLFDYATHRRRLIPRVAEVYALHFAHEELVQHFDDVFSGRADTPQNRQDLETMAAALKATSTWFALDTLQACREACGGAGFLAENRITSLRADFDVFTTFEGDNTVLLQLVAKRLVADYARQVATKLSSGTVGSARFVAGQVVDAALYTLPVARAAQAAADLATGVRGHTVTFDADTQRGLLADRVAAKTAAVAAALRPARTAAPEAAARIVDDQQVALVDLARSYAELLRWAAFTRAIATIADDGTRTVLGWVRDAYALTVIERDLAWFVIHGRLANTRARAVTRTLDALLRQLRPHVGALVDAWGLTDDHLRAVIASGVEGERQAQAQAYRAAQRAAGTAPRPEPRPAAGPR
jgi:acyl-CoA oxidase